jgi:preprotein translocase subunit SecG
MVAAPSSENREGTMYGVLLTLHIIICFALICAVLLQSGKGGGLAGGAFGGTAQTVLGGRGATDFITRATMVLGGAFFATSLILALMSAGRVGAPRSLLQEEARRQQSTAPARVPSQPGQQPAAPGQQSQPPSQQAPATPQTPAPQTPPSSPP